MKSIPLCIFVAVLSAASSAEAAEDDPGKYVGLMSQYLTLTEQVSDVASRPESTLFLAVEGIFEIYEQRRDAPAAIKHLERILADHGNNRTLRNIVRLKLRDIYKETGQGDKALEQLDLMIDENAG